MTLPTVKIRILDGETLNDIGTLEILEDAEIYERVNNKYTFDFTCYDQPNINLLNASNIILADSDYFRVASIVESPITKRFEVTCEHISYELNTPRNEIKATYIGTPMEIVNQILTDNDTRFVCMDSDFNQVVEWATTTGNVRSRIMEFGMRFGFEIKWLRFQVAILRRRGHDYGLSIELGKNLKDLTVTKTFNFDGSVTTSYDIDFIDLNKVVDDEGNPLEQYEFHLGDTVYLKLGNKVIEQRGIAVAYNPFRRELPTIELESPTNSLTDALSNDVSKVRGSSNNKEMDLLYVIETGSDMFSEGMIFEFTKSYSRIISVTVSITTPNVPGNVYYKLVRSGRYFTGVSVHSNEFLEDVEVSMQAIVDTRGGDPIWPA